MRRYDDTRAVVNSMFLKIHPAYAPEISGRFLGNVHLRHSGGDSLPRITGEGFSQGYILDQTTRHEEPELTQVSFCTRRRLSL